MRRAALFMAAGLGVAIFGWRHLPGGDVIPTSREAASPSGAPSRPAPEAGFRPLSCWARAGGVYEVEVSTRFRFAAPTGGETRAMRSGSTAWRGELHVAPDPGAGAATVSLRDVVVEAGEQESVLRLLEAPARVDVDRRCRVLRFHFAAGLAPAAKDQWKLLASLGELLLPGEDDGEQWQRRQEDPTGTAVVRYQRPAADRLVKEKLGYEALAARGGGARMVAEVGASRTEARFSPQGRLGSVTGVEALSLIDADSGRPMAEARTRFAWALAPDREADVSAPGPLAAASAGMALTQPEARHFDAFEGPPPKTLEAAKRLFEQELERAGLRAALGVLVPFLRAHPDAAFALLDELRNRAFSREAHRHAFLALELARTPEARAALASALNDASFETGDRLRAAVALPDAGKPEASVDAIRTASHDADPEVAGASRLALGRVAGRSDLPAPERRQIVDELEQSLNTAETLNDQVLAMEALANTGDPAVGAALRPHLEAADPLLRAAAAEGLRSLEASWELDRVLDLLASEASVPAQRALAELLATRTEDAGPRALAVVQQKLLTGDELPSSVAKPLISFLAAQGAFHPTEVRVVLDTVVTRYRDRDVRRFAAKYL